MYTEALHFYNMILKKTKYGKDHPAVALSLVHKGILLNRLHKYDASEKCFQHATRICEQVFGLDSPQVGAILGNWAYVYRNKKEYTPYKLEVNYRPLPTSVTLGNHR